MVADKNQQFMNKLRQLCGCVQPQCSTQTGGCTWMRQSLCWSLSAVAAVGVAVVGVGPRLKQHCGGLPH